LQEETPEKWHGKMTKHCQMKSECKTNCLEGTCRECIAGHYAEITLLKHHICA